MSQGIENLVPAVAVVLIFTLAAMKLIPEFLKYSSEQESAEANCYQELLKAIKNGHQRDLELLGVLQGLKDDIGAIRGVIERASRGEEI